MAKKRFEPIDIAVLILVIILIVWFIAMLLKG